MPRLFRNPFSSVPARDAAAPDGGVAPTAGAPAATPAPAREGLLSGLGNRQGRFSLDRGLARARGRRMDLHLPLAQFSVPGQPLSTTTEARHVAAVPAAPAAAAPPSSVRRTVRHTAAALRRLTDRQVRAAADGALIEPADAAPPAALHAARDGNALDAFVATHLAAAAPQLDDPARQQLSARLARLGAPEAGAPAMHGALIADALMQEGIDDAEQAARLLDELGQATPLTLSEPTGAAAALLRRLMRSGAGEAAFEAIRADAGHALPAPTVLALRIACEARSALADQAPQTDAALARRACAAARALLAGGRNALDADQREAYFTWRQGFRETGPGSSLAQARSRLDKFCRTTVPRVETSALGRLAHLPMRIVGHSKSPLSVLTDGAPGMNRDTLAGERRALTSALRDAWPLLDGSRALAPAQALRHHDPARAMAETAATILWLRDARFAGPNIDAASLQELPRRTRELAEALGAQAAPREEAARQAILRACEGWQRLEPAALRRVQALRFIVRRDFSVDHLAQLGARCGLTEQAGFQDCLRRAREAMAPTAPQLPTRDRGAARALLSGLVGDLRSGARLRVADGRRAGASTRGLGISIGNALHLSGVPIVPRIDVRDIRARQAVVEISRSTQGVEFFAGTERRIERQAGGGCYVGYDFDFGAARARVGGALNVLAYASERSRQCGLSLRVVRGLNAAGNNFDDARMRAKLQTLVEQLFDPLDAATGDPWQRLADTAFDDPEVSAAWRDTQRANASYGASLEAGLTFRLPLPGVGGSQRSTASDATGSAASVENKVLPPNLGVSAGIAGIRQRYQYEDDAGASGAQRVEQHRAGAGKRLVTRVGIGFSASTEVGRGVSVGLLTLDAPALHIVTRGDYQTTRVQLARQADRLNHRACLMDQEFTSKSAYVESVAARRDAWVRLFAHARLNPGEQPTQAQLADAGRRIDAHLAEVNANWRPNQVLFHRSRLHAHAARRLDMNRALWQQGGTARLEALAAENAAILDDPANWMPFELKARERIGRDRTIGPNVFLNLAARNEVSVDREFAVENVPFRVLEMLDAMPADDAPGASVTGHAPLPPAAPAVAASTVLPASVAPMPMPVTRTASRPLIAPAARSTPSAPVARRMAARSAAPPGTRLATVAEEPEANAMPPTPATRSVVTPRALPPPPAAAAGTAVRDAPRARTAVPAQPLKSAARTAAVAPQTRQPSPIEGEAFELIDMPEAVDAMRALAALEAMDAAQGSTAEASSTLPASRQTER